MDELYNIRGVSWCYETQVFHVSFVFSSLWTLKNTITLVRCPCENMFAFDTCSLISNLPYKRVHTTGKSSTVEELDEDADCNSSVCK